MKKNEKWIMDFWGRNAPKGENGRKTQIFIKVFKKNLVIFSQKTAFFNFDTTFGIILYIFYVFLCVKICMMLEVYTRGVSSKS